MEELTIALEALQYAMYNERLGYRFYIKAMEMTTDEKGKRMYHSIASDEMEHLRILQEEFDSLKKTGDWVSLERTGVEKPSPSAPPLFPEEEAEAEELIRSSASDLDALDIALDLERRGYELYQQEAQKASNLTARAIYEYLAKEENKHFTLLQNTRSYLAASGIWLWDDMHPPMLD